MRVIFVANINLTRRQKTPCPTQDSGRKSAPHTLYTPQTPPPCSMSTTTSTVSIPQLAQLLQDHVQTHPQFANHEVLLAQRRLGGICLRDRRSDVETHVVHCMAESGSAARWPFISETRPCRLLRQPGIVSTWGLDHTRVDLADFVADGELGQMIVELLRRRRRSSTAATSA